MTKKSESEATEVVVKGPSAVGDVIDWGQHAGEGFENQSQDDILLPYLEVLQPSERRDDPRSETPPRGEVGDIFNTVSREIHKSRVVIPCTSQHYWNEWERPEGEESGGTIVRQFLPSDPFIQQVRQTQKFGEYVNPDTGNELTDTFYLYVLELADVHDAVPAGRAVVAFTSTKIGAYKRINSQMRGFTIEAADGRKVKPNMWGHRLVLASEVHVNKAGQKSRKFTLAPALGSIKESLVAHTSLLAEGKDFKDTIAAGLTRADYGRGVASEDGAQGGGAKEQTGDLPF